MAQVTITREGSLARIEASEIYAHSCDKVFAFFAEHSNLSRLFGGRIERIQASAQQDPNGLGSVRRVYLPPGPAFEEEIVAFDPPHRIEYRVSRGSPVKNHHGRMQFSGDERQCEMHYRIELQGRIPGTTGLIARMMAKTLRQGLPQLESLLQGQGA